ncbi:unnamed protein product, partial [Rotaria sp. Silwood2]
GSNLTFMLGTLLGDTSSGSNMISSF